MATNMIKFPILTDETKKIRHVIPAKFVTVNSATTNGNEYVPIRVGGFPTVNSVNELGKALLKAAGDGNVEELKFLLTKGAPFTADWLGTSPLHLAAQNNNLEVCEILLRAGISKDARTKVDRTPLHMAAYEGHFDIVNVLLKEGADEECKDLLGMTPLHWAVQNGHQEVVKLLISKGCDPYVRNKFSLSPVDIANQIGRTDIINILNSDSRIATQNLVIQLASESGENSTEYPAQEIEHIQAMPVDTVLLEEDMELDVSKSGEEVPEEPTEVELPDTVVTTDNNFSDSIKLLQEHGITMLPNEENNILSTVMESGHSVVLTEVGKEVLDSVKQSEEALASQNKKVYTVSADQFLGMTNGTLQKTNIRPLRVIYKNPPKRVMMKKNKIIPISTVPQLPKIVQAEKKNSLSDMEFVMSQLVEARKTIEEYKIKLRLKEKEAEKYKQQLQLLMDTN